MSKNPNTPSEEQTKHYIKEFGTSLAFRLSREGDLDLCFAGWLVSEAREPESKERSTVSIRIFATNTGRFVGEITRRIPNINGSEYPSIIKSKCRAFDVPTELLEWLREDGRGRLGANSKAAWENLCDRVPWLSDVAVIHV
jgi:hypothetical protein